MSSHIAGQSTIQGNEAPEKGKGKAPTCAEDPEDETTESESVCDEHEEEEEEEEEEDMAEIDTSNIIQTGRRTRGKKIDFAAADADAMDDDSDDDEDFVAAEDDKTDA